MPVVYSIYLVRINNERLWREEEKLFSKILGDLYYDVRERAGCLVFVNEEALPSGAVSTFKEAVKQCRSLGRIEEITL